MITPQEATDLREFLIIELNSNGFSDIVTEVSTRLEEDYEEESFERSPRNLLDFFLTQSIETLENLSNSNLQGIISRLNKFIQSSEKIQSINVELLNDGEQTYYDLKELPDYSEIISTFTEVLEEIRKEN
jgi:hypothetical protein